MPWYDFLWNPERSGNCDHIAEHGICQDEVEWVVQHPLAVGSSRSSGCPVAVGRTPAGRLLIVVYEHIDHVTVYPVTAYEIEDA
jgi:hypothetical protein